jgi:limonene-1,2-epoxide hydrolase
MDRIAIGVDRTNQHQERRTVKPQPISLFKSMFARLTPDTVMPLADLYAKEIVFEDPLHRIVGLEALAAYFTRLNARVEFVEFAFGTQVVAADKAALTWTMTVRTRRPRQTIVVPGVSVIAFTDRITHQRDYFDVGAMLYERIPLFGWMLRRLKRMIG